MKKWMIGCAAFMILALLPAEAKGIATSKRLSGSNRYQTAVSVSKEGWQYSNYVVLVTGENYPDALSAAPLAYKYNCPILLSLKDTLDVNTSVEIKRLKATNAFIVGGTGVISKTVEDKLTSMGIKVKRIAGNTRYDTALEVANSMGNVKEAVLANGEEFNDALSIASIAASKGMPILLTPGGNTPAAVKNYLSGNTLSGVYVMGGEDQVSANAVSGIPNITRIFGNTPYERNIQAISTFGAEVDFGTTYIATGKDYPDALAGAALAAKSKSSVILVGDSIPGELKGFFDSKLIQKLNILGGPAAVSYDLEKAIKTLPLEVSSTNNITETINQNQNYTPPKTIIVTTSDNNKNELPIQWNLTKVDTTKPGIFTFTGKVEGYDNPVTLKLYVKPIVYKVDDLTAEANFKDTYVVPDAISAQMSDGTISNVPVIWSYPTSTNSKPGVYVFLGKIEGYAKTVKLTLTVNTTNPGGGDPNNPNDPYIGDVADEVIQDQKYTLQKSVSATMKDGTVKQLTVNWGTSKVDTSTIGKIIVDGTVQGYSGKVKLTVTIKPKVQTVYNLTRTITRNYPYTLPTNLTVALTDNIKKEVPVIWDMHTVDTSSVGSYVVKGKLDTYGDPVTLTINVVRDYIVTFADSNLMAAIREKVDKYSGNIYKSDVEKITSLDASGKGIIDLSGIGELTNLQTLKLNNNTIANVDDISYLADLKELDLESNLIQNINFFRRLINLQTLNLADNSLRYINGLEELNQLQELYLKNNYIVDYSPVTYYYSKLKESDFTY